MSKLPRPIRLVALDIGNTCITLHPERLRAALGLADDFPRLGPETNQGPFREFLLGNITEEAYLQWFYEEYHRRWAPGLIYAAHAYFIGPAIPGMPEFIRGLADQGAHIVFFSDINTLHFRSFRAITAGQYDFITDMVGSDEVHALKPSEEMFAAFEHRWGVPDLYLDDRKELTDAALARGWPLAADQAKGRKELGIREAIAKVPVLVF